MAFTLYNAPQSTCSQRVRFVLNAKGLAFEEKKLDLLEGDQLKPDYLALNPNGVVPTLVHDGEVVIDSTVIIEYLDEVAPQGETFTPREPGERARMRSLMRFIDEMPAAAVRVPTFNLAFLPRFAKMSEEEFLAFAESKPLRKEFMLAMGRTGFPEKDMNASLERMRRTYERMDAAIAAERWPVPPGLAADARRHFGDAGAGAHGRPRPCRHVGRPAGDRPLVRGDPRPSCLQADLLSGLAAHRDIPAPAGQAARPRGLRPDAATKTHLRQMIRRRHSRTAGAGASHPFREAPERSVPRMRCRFIAETASDCPHSWKSIGSLVTEP